MKDNLLKSIERYKTIYQLSPEAIGILDKEGFILDINERVYDWLGYKPEEVIGKHILKVPYLTKESKAEIKEKFSQRISGKEAPPYEVDFISKKGKRITGRIVAAPIRDENGTIIGDVVMISDVTEIKKIEKKLRESEKKYRILFENAPVGIGISDENGNILDANQNMIEITGYSLEELKKISLKDTYINSKDRKKLVEELWKTGNIREWEVELRRKDGTTYWALLNIDLTEINGKKLALTTARDITELRKIDKAKTDFVSLASHQLRTPLSVISWYAEILLKENVDKMDKKEKEYLEEIYKNNKKLIDLVNALLNVSRIELNAFTIEPEPTNLIEIANNVLNEFLSEIKKKKLRVTNDYGKNLPIIDVDPNLMRIVFQNLFSNAIKYTPPGGNLDLLIKKQASNLLIKVSDNGYGIPKEEQDQIFTKFFRAYNIKEKEFDGTGLGLYIVKSIVEQAGGKIWFKSEENQGTIFYVLIPLKGMKKKKGIKKLS